MGPEPRHCFSFKCNVLSADLDNVATDIAIGAAMFRHGSSSETSTASLDGSNATRPGDRVSILWKENPILGSNSIIPGF